MKHILFFIALSFLSGTSSAHQTTINEHTEYIKKNSYWAIGPIGTLMLCYGIDQFGVPVCATVPKQYAVFELPKKLQ